MKRILIGITFTVFTLGAQAVCVTKENGQTRITSEPTCPNGKEVKYTGPMWTAEERAQRAAAEQRQRRAPSRGPLGPALDAIRDMPPEMQAKAYANLGRGFSGMSDRPSPPPLSKGPSLYEKMQKEQEKKQLVDDIAETTSRQIERDNYFRRGR